MPQGYTQCILVLESLNVILFELHRAPLMLARREIIVPTRSHFCKDISQVYLGVIMCENNPSLRCISLFLSFQPLLKLKGTGSGVITGGCDSRPSHNHNNNNNNHHRWSYFGGIIGISTVCKHQDKKLSQSSNRSQWMAGERPRRPFTSVMHEKCASSEESCEVDLELRLFCHKVLMLLLRQIKELRCA